MINLLYSPLRALFFATINKEQDILKQSATQLIDFGLLVLVEKHKSTEDHHIVIDSRRISVKDLF